MSFGKVLKGALTGGLVGAAKAGNVSLGDIARNGGFGALGMLAAKKRRDNATGTPSASTPVGGPVADRNADVKEYRRGGKTKGEPTGGKKVSKAKRYAAGGSASKRADGCATKGKTKGRFV